MIEYQIINPEMDMKVFIGQLNQMGEEIRNLKKDLKQMTLNFATLSEIACESDDADWIRSEYEKQFKEVSMTDRINLNFSCPICEKNIDIKGLEVFPDSAPVRIYCEEVQTERTELKCPHCYNKMGIEAHYLLHDVSVDFNNGDRIYIPINRKKNGKPAILELDDEAVV